MADFPITDQTKVRRLPARGRYDRETVYGILDEAVVCQVGFVQEGQPAVIPTLFARLGDELILHGSSASRMLSHIAAGHPVCVSVTLVDGLVLARSAFHHSINYRSAVLFGRGRLVESEAEKLRALEVLTEHILPGRWSDARRPTPRELRVTGVVLLPIESASAKIRSGPPVDDDEDYGLPVWAGVLPLRQQPLAPVADPRLAAGIAVPDYLARYVAGKR